MSSYGPCGSLETLKLSQHPLTSVRPVQDKLGLWHVFVFFVFAFFLGFYSVQALIIPRRLIEVFGHIAIFFEHCWNSRCFHKIWTFPPLTTKIFQKHIRKIMGTSWIYYFGKKRVWGSNKAPIGLNNLSEFFVFWVFNVVMKVFMGSKYSRMAN